MQLISPVRHIPTADDQNFVAAYLQENNPTTIDDKVIYDCNGLFTRVELVMHAVLKNLPFGEQCTCINKVKSYFKEDAFYKDPKVSIGILYTPENISIPHSLLPHLTILNEMLKEDGDAEPFMSLPYKISAKDMETYFEFLGQDRKPIPDFKTWLQVLISAERFGCDEEITKYLRFNKPPIQGTLEEIEFALSLQGNMNSILEDSIISELLNSYITHSLENHGSIHEICATLDKSEVFKKNISIISVTLALENPTFSSELEKLAALLPKVTDLRVRMQYTTTFPTVWENTLLKLHLLPSEIKEIPEALLARLNSLELTCTDLRNYSVLNNRTNLQNLRLCRLRNLVTVPIGCSNLETFVAEDCSQLNDITALNDLLRLRSCTLTNIPLVNIAPSGCLNLEEFIAESCSSLMIACGLNNLPKLKSCRFTESAFLVIPSGCISLEKFVAIRCGIFNYQEINNLPNLKTFILAAVTYFDNTDLTAIAPPSRWLNLTHFEATNCHCFTNIDRLNNLPELKECIVSGSAITKAPSGCLKLEKFIAEGCTNLYNIEGLYNLLNLNECTLTDTPLNGTIPSGCPKLIA